MIRRRRTFAVGLSTAMDVHEQAEGEGRPLGAPEVLALARDVERARQVDRFRTAGLRVPAVAPATIGPRKRGRPGWSKALLRERLSAAEARTNPPRTLPRIAENFEGLGRDHAIGVDPEWLGRLIRRYESGDMPE